jgi:SAM-dependent methyltransferase
MGFDRRAPTYEHGFLGRWHSHIDTAVAELIASIEPTPRRILDVGCGTGRLLRQLAEALPSAHLIGLDCSPAMVAQARWAGKPYQGRIRFVQCRAESMPLAADSCDLVLTSLSFDHWDDQRAGLRECARVLSAKGTFLLIDLVGTWPGLSARLSARNPARTRPRIEALLRSCGLDTSCWTRLYCIGPIALVQAVRAKPATAGPEVEDAIAI